MASAAATPQMLVVDDEAHTLELVRRTLRERCDVLSASSGEQGLGLLRDHPNVFMVLSDARMPGMSGSRFLAESMSVAPDAVRVMMTGFADYDVIVDAINDAKVFGYLRK